MKKILVLAALALALVAGIAAVTTIPLAAPAHADGGDCSTC